ncbi:multidrug efflux RND transporter permease subunit [Comamonas sp. CMM01]|uniref:multidrug efflux RND transporter permease subunit n=1 Tax=Comamonas sp. CMM01 TaxID=2769280 RepID=UPI001783509C|nr:multidrug efflux RND transporter permease subunit [Comamonas sp. CMM01]MBD9531220.1 multidrug efflux RND transporter permease subunit [Comamonas sp. CMM01]
MSKFFIGRPNFAWVVAIFITLAGVLSIPSLPVSQFPVVAPPQITVAATYPGASAKDVSESVTSILEEEINGAKGMLYFESSSSNASAEITVTFKPGMDADLAQVDVQNRLKKAEARLPSAVTQQGLQVEQANAGFLLIYSLRYKAEDSSKDVVELADYAARRINNEIRRIPGVGKLQFFSSEAAMRVWVDPQKLLGYGLSIADVNSAIAAQNVQVPAGSFGSRPGTAEQELTATLAVKGMLESPEEFGRIVLRANTDGSAVRLGDVARLEIGRQDYSVESRQDGRKAVAAAVQLAPGANALQTADAVKARLNELSAAFPADIEHSIAYDTSLFVKVAIEKVIYTLLEAMVLVFLVMLLFLQNLRYTLIPTIVVPVCLMGTFAVMSLLGFSVNMMTMFGMVLAIGILVDDAIVVVENVERIMTEEGLSPAAATVKAMSQVSGAIVGITLVLAAVFLPLAFMSGSVGVIYQQFSLSLAVSILFSGFLALTFTPALCATLLKPVAMGHHDTKRGFFGWFNRSFERLTGRFEALNHRLLRRTGRYMVIYAALVGVLGWMYVRVPESFVPSEDQGYMIVDMQLPPGASYARTEALVKDVEQYLAERKTLSSSFSVLGFSFSGTGQNAALGFPTFKDWSERKGAGESAADEAGALNARFAGNPDGTVMAVTPPPIEGLGNAGGFSLRLQDRGGVGREVLTQALGTLLYKANTSPVIAYAMMEGLADAPQLRLDVDRAKAQALGVGFDTISTALSTAFGSATVNDFANAGRLQRVVVQADVRDRATPESILTLHVPNRAGDQVPLSAFVTAQWENGPVQISRYNGYQAFKIGGDARPGYSTGEAMAELERIMKELPEGIGYEWTGLSYQERFAGAQAPILFALAILVVFLLLVALYESWAIPASVMLIVPIGALGSVLAVTVAGLTNDVYFKVGLITVIGLAAKNAILIVEFAKALREQGLSLVEAAVTAARLRFRPIVMTSLAFILGVVPLVIATGAGAASQRSLGTGVIGGMLSATLLGVVFVPVFFVWVLSLLGDRKGKKQQADTAGGQTAPAAAE